MHNTAIEAPVSKLAGFSEAGRSAPHFSRSPENSINQKGSFMPRRIILSGLTAFILAIILAACGSTSGGPTTAPPPPPPDKGNYTIYTFEGEISNLFYDGGGIIVQGGYKVGDPVFAKFHVDFKKPGYFLLNNGEVETPTSPSLGNDPHWYFLSELIDGTLLPTINGGLFNGPEDVKEYHIGWDASGPAGNSGLLQGGTGNSNFTVQKDSQLDATVENWVIGEHLKGIIVGCSDKDCSIIWADMILKDIQTVSK